MYKIRLLDLPILFSGKIPQWRDLLDNTGNIRQFKSEKYAKVIVNAIAQHYQDIKIVKF